MQIGDHVEKKRTGRLGTITGLGRIWLTVRPHNQSRKELWRRDEVWSIDLRPCPCGEMTIDDCAGECGKPARHPEDCEHPRCDLAF